MEIKMKNGDLIVNGVAAEQFVPEDQTTTEALVGFEFDAYQAYDALHGDGACGHDGIDTLADLFGQEMSDRVYRQRVKLMAERNIVAVSERIARDTIKVANLQKLIDNPTTDLNDVFNT